MLKKLLTLLILLSGILSTLPAQAIQLTEGDYRHREDVVQFIQRVAEKTDYSEQQLVDLFSQARQQTHLFERMDKPAEKKLEWHQYRKIFITDKRINKGIEFWQNNRELLQQVEQRYKVPAEIIIAIVGVETFYGVYKGKAPVFDTLVTFAFDYPKRAKFFTRELEEFLILSSTQKFDVRAVMGSYAGAMGMPQFISSSYRHYAVDFDGDGVANLFDSLPDVLGSVANYFVKHGWREGESIAYPLAASSPQKLAQMSTGFKLDYQWDQLKAAGLASDGSTLQATTPVALVRLQQEESTDYWAGLKNFYVITRYNHSDMYAMAVYQLSQKLRAGVQL